MPARRARGNGGAEVAAQTFQGLACSVPGTSVLVITVTQGLSPTKTAGMREFWLLRAFGSLGSRFQAKFTVLSRMEDPEKDLFMRRRRERLASKWRAALE